MQVTKFQNYVFLFLIGLLWSTGHISEMNPVTRGITIVEQVLGLHIESGQELSSSEANGLRVGYDSSFTSRIQVLFPHKRGAARQ